MDGERDVTYIYYRKDKKCQGHKGIVCVGYNVLPSGHITYTVALCSPKDRFSRKAARHHINERITNSNVVRVFVGSADGPPKYKDIVVAVANSFNTEIVNDRDGYAKSLGFEKGFPNWVKPIDLTNPNSKNTSVVN